VRVQLQIRVNCSLVGSRRRWRLMHRTKSASILLIYDYARCYANPEAWPSVLGDGYVRRAGKTEESKSGTRRRFCTRFLLHYYIQAIILLLFMFITLVAHSLFSTATGPRRMALTVNRVHNNNIYQLAPRSHSHWRAHAVFGYHRPHRRDLKHISLSSSGSQSINIINCSI